MKNRKSENKSQSKFHLPLIPSVTALICLILFALIAQSNYQISLQNKKNQAIQTISANTYVLSNLIEQQIEKAQTLALLHYLAPQSDLQAYIAPLYLQQGDLLSGWLLTQQTRVVASDSSNISTTRIGNDLSKDSTYSQGLSLALQTRRVNIRPAVDTQGSALAENTLICFIPIFNYENGLTKDVQGSLIILLNMDRLMGQSGLLAITRTYRLGIFELDSSQAPSSQIQNSTPIFSNYPGTDTDDFSINTNQALSIPIEINNAKWILYASPILGWQTSLVAPLAIMVTGLALALVSSGYVNRLIGSRDALNKEVEDRTEELRHSNAYLEKSLAALEDKQSELESVNYRLESVNSRLEDSLKALQIAQEQLVRNEKLASLGELVGGVAHEINTPLGIAVTVASYLKDKCTLIYEDFKSGQLKRSDLEHHLESSTEAFTSLEGSLQRSVDIISSFKVVAIDPSNLEASKINVSAYLNELLDSLRPRLESAQHRVHFNCPTQLEIITYPGALAHIVTNLVLNSLIHGFENQVGGIITVDVELVDLGPLRHDVPQSTSNAKPNEKELDMAYERGHIVQLRYSDNGSGIPISLSERIFDPFFTTKRIKGCTGLGLHIVNNMVTQVLKGQLLLTRPEPPETGAIFTLRFPV